MNGETQAYGREWQNILMKSSEKHNREVGLTSEKPVRLPTHGKQMFCFWLVVIIMPTLKWK